MLKQCEGWIRMGPSRAGGSIKHGNEPSDSTKDRVCLDHLSDYQLHEVCYLYAYLNCIAILIKSCYSLHEYFAQLRKTFISKSPVQFHSSFDQHDGRISSLVAVGDSDSQNGPLHQHNADMSLFCFRRQECFLFM